MAHFLLIRRYAPFKTFGGGFEGDTRTEATTSPTATARTVGVVAFTQDTAVPFGGFSSGSTFEGAGPWLAEKIGRHYSKVKAEISDVKPIGKTLSFTVHTSGANPLVPIVAPPIDTFVDLTITFDSYTEFDGTVRGDNFPNAEIFVVMEGRRDIMLFDFHTGAGQNTGPMTRLFGEHADQVLGTISVNVPPIGPMPMPPKVRGT